MSRVFVIRICIMCLMCGLLACATGCLYILGDSPPRNSYRYSYSGYVLQENGVTPLGANKITVSTYAYRYDCDGVLKQSLLSLLDHESSHTDQQGKYGGHFQIDTPNADTSRPKCDVVFVHIEQARKWCVYKVGFDNEQRAKLVRDGKLVLPTIVIGRDVPFATLATQPFPRP